MKKMRTSGRAHFAAVAVAVGAFASLGGVGYAAGLVHFAHSSPTNAPTSDAAGRPFIDPILEYKHPPRNRPPTSPLEGASITGGYVYRGKALPQLQGRYVFADWSRHFVVPQGVLFVATRPSTSGQKQWSLEQLKPVTHPKEHLGMFVVAIGEDADGELYFLTNTTNGLIGKNGKVFKLVPM